MINVAALALKACLDEPLNVVTDLPAGAVRPITRLQENGVVAPSSHMPDWLYEQDFQMDTWGTTQADTFQLLSDVFAVFRTHPENVYGQVTRFELVGQDYQPDADWEVNGRPGPRYISIVRLFAHP